MEYQASAPPAELGEEESSNIHAPSFSESDSNPSAPPEERPVFSLPVSEVELTLSASSLLNLDQLTHSDPMCVLFLLDSTTSGEWIELGRTEAVLNNLNPEWKTKFLLDYRFEERQLLTFMIYDKDCAKVSLDNHDFLGKLECSLGEIISAPHSKALNITSSNAWSLLITSCQLFPAKIECTRSLKLPVIYSTSNSNSTLTVVSEEIGDCKKVISCRIRYYPTFRSTSSRITAPKKAFLNISKQHTDGTWILLHRTDKLPITNQTDCLDFLHEGIRYSSVCSKGNVERPLRFQINYVEHSLRGKSTRLSGQFITNFIELDENCGNGRTAKFQLQSGKNDKSVKTENTGEVAISNFSIEPQKTFMDYLQEGLEINFAVAIDFTASNGEPTNHASLHYKHGQRDNPYVMTLKIVGEILEDYSTSKQFYAYGFGAKGFPLANRVNHKFALNFKENNPSCDGIEGVLNAYLRCLHRVKLYGPTCFAPIIREVTGLAKGSVADGISKYFVLLILTDGVVCDPETTMDALVEASEVPMSVIIIGIGNEDFTSMERFDGDDKLLKSRSKKIAKRDIVQFVELRKFVNFKSISPISNGSKVALAKSVLAELPQQVVAWMKLEK